jgi:lipopolysaccharide transport system ATP-binding protein
MSSEIAIKVNNLSKCYEIYERPHDRLKQFVLPKIRKFFGFLQKQYFKEFWALKDVSFEVKKGETVGIVGRNGSGKSTLLQMICGTLNPTGGEINTHGRIAALLELGSGFNPEFTGRENIFMNAAVLGLSNQEILDKFEEIVAFADIGEFIDHPVKTYSSGMTVRLAFAVSVGIDPDILIIDEALAVGDAPFQFKCLERLRQLTESGATLLFVSHDIHMVKSFCIKSIYLERGVLKGFKASEIIAEEYMRDMRQEQQLIHSKEAQIIKKDSLSGSNIAFGTTQGRIEKIKFLGDGLMRASYCYGDIATIVAEVSYDDSIQKPHFSIYIQNQKMIELAGRSFALQAFSQQDGKCKAKISINIPIHFGNGEYFITARLENRLSRNEQVPLDKQVGVLSFSVANIKTDFLGPIDIGILKSEND